MTKYFEILVCKINDMGGLGISQRWGDYACEEGKLLEALRELDTLDHDDYEVDSCGDVCIGQWVYSLGDELDPDHEIVVPR